MKLAFVVAAAAVAASTVACAQTPAQADASPAKPVAPSAQAMLFPESPPMGGHAADAARPCCLLLAGTVVEVELSQDVTTKKVKSGDHFRLRLAAPILVDGKVVAPKGAVGEGEVVDAADGGFAGKPAKLVLAARYVEFDGHRVILRAFRLSGSGRNNSDVAMAVSVAPYVGLLALAVPGGGVAYPAGTVANAKVAADIILPAITDAPPPAPAPTEPPSTSKQGTTP